MSILGNSLFEYHRHWNSPSMAVNDIISKTAIQRSLLGFEKQRVSRVIEFLKTFLPDCVNIIYYKSDLRSLLHSLNAWHSCKWHKTLAF